MSEVPSGAQAAMLERLRRQARRSTIHLLKGRARDFIHRPSQLENLYPGLAAAAPDTLIAVAEHLLAAALEDPRRWFGFGGEVPMVNAKAALLLGRTLRRAARREVNEQAN